MATAHLPYPNPMCGQSSCITHNLPPVANNAEEDAITSAKLTFAISWGPQRSVRKQHHLKLARTPCLTSPCVGKLATSPLPCLEAPIFGERTKLRIVW